jgi:DNA-binding MarR family transcriptional regulator
MSEPQVDQPLDSEAADALTVAGELRTVIGKLNRRLREESSVGDFTESQKSVITRLDREGAATLASLARAEGMRPQSMGSIVSVLTTAGMVTGTPDPSDGRQIILSLTQRAHDELLAGRAARQDWLFRSMTAKLTLAEQRELAHGIQLLKRLVES